MDISIDTKKGFKPFKVIIEVTSIRDLIGLTAMFGQTENQLKKQVILDGSQVMRSAIETHGIHDAPYIGYAALADYLEEIL